MEPQHPAHHIILKQANEKTLSVIVLLTIVGGAMAKGKKFYKELTYAWAGIGIVVLVSSVTFEA